MKQFYDTTRISTMKRISAVLLAVLVAAGCEAATDGAGEWAVDTLPNGAVRVMNQGEGLWGDEGGWHLEPELTIGELDGPDEEVFATIIDLEVDDEGRIYVLDREANELRIFRPDGTHVRTAGRAGEGPGEYSNANGLLWLAPDTLVVVDQRGNRYSILSRDGDFVRSVQRGHGFFGWAFDGGIRDGTVLERSTVGSAEDTRPVLLATSLHDDGDAPRDTLPLPRPTGALYESFSVQTEEGLGMVMGVPFTPSPVYYLDHRGDLWHGHGEAMRLTRSTLDGDTLLQIELEAEPVPVGDAELEEWESGDGVARFRELGGELDMERIPREKPFFDDIFLEPDGHVWVSVPAPPDEARFRVFDPDGRYLGPLRIEGLRLNASVSPVVRGDRLHLVAYDELDVPQIRVFRIER